MRRLRVGRGWGALLVWLCLLSVSTTTQAQTPLTENYVLQDSWGGEARPGFFLYPEGLDSDAAGRLYIVDRGNDRIQVLDAERRVLSAWGRRGSAPLQFRDPHDLAISLTLGRAYVTDGGNARVQVFNLAGQYITQLGQRGVGPGRLIEPYGVAVGPDNKVYVTDRAARVVQVFASSGEPAERWGRYGVDAGSFLAPQGIAVDTGGQVYVADPRLGQVKKFSPDGTPIATWSGQVPGARPFQQPTDVAIGDDGEVYILDRGTPWVQVFAPDGAFKRGWINPLVPTPPPAWHALGLSARGQVALTEGRPPNSLAAGGWGHGVLLFSPSGALVDSATNAMSAGDGLRWPASLAYSDGLLYIPDGQPVPGRVLDHIRVYNASGQLAETRTWPNWLGQTLTASAEQRRLAVGSAAGYQVIDTDGVERGRFGITGEASGAAQMTAGGVRYLFGATPRLQRLLRFNLENGLTDQFSPPDTGPTPLLWPLSLVTTSTGQLRVSDPLRSQIQTFGPDGDLRGVIQLDTPLGSRHVGVTPDGNLVVTLYDGRLRKMRPDGVTLAEWSIPQAGALPPRAVAAAGGESGRIFALDRANGLVLAFVPSSPTFATATPTAPPPTSDCRLSVDQQLTPSSSVLGELVTVDLTLRHLCAVEPLPADIVLGLSYTERRAQERADVSQALQDFVSALDPDRHRLGVLADNPYPVVAASLREVLRDTAEQVNAVLAALPFPEGGHVASLLERASEELATRSRDGAAPVVVLLTDSSADPVALFHAARHLQAQGVWMMVIAYGGRADDPLLRLVASSPDDVFIAPTVTELSAALTAIRGRVDHISARRVTVRTTLSSRVVYDGSAQEPLRVGASLTWTSPATTDAPLTFSFRVRPTSLGSYAVMSSGQVEYVDQRGVTLSAPIPPALLEVTQATATVTPLPTSTTTVTPTATETPTPTETPVFTPTPTATETATPSATLTATSSASPTVSPPPTTTETPAPTATVTATFTASPSATAAATLTATSAPTSTPTPLAVLTPSVTTTATHAPTDTPTPTATTTFILLPSATVSITATATSAPSVTPTATPSATLSLTPTATPTMTPSVTPPATLTFTPSPPTSPTVTPTSEPTDNATETPSPTPSATLTFTPSPLPTASASSTPSPSPTTSTTVTETPVPALTATPTATSVVTPRPEYRLFIPYLRQARQR